MNLYNIQRYLDELRFDIYPQPPDAGHTAWSMDVIDGWDLTIRACRSVLDVGCGQAFLQPAFEMRGLRYAGVCLGDDFSIARHKRRTVYEMDFHDLGFPDDSFDLIFARHVLEHSPMPLIALMEWHRVGKNMILVMPRPEYWGDVGRNHYAVMSNSQIRFLLERAGWLVVDSYETEQEFRYSCKRVERPIPFYKNEN